MASYSLSPSLVFKGFYDDNSPLVGGKVYTWLAGTTTPTPTYQSNGGAANTNPVILDSRGEANVWLNPSISYKIEVTDADGNIVIPAKDNIQGSDSGALNAASVNTVAFLRAYAGTATLIYCHGYYAANDGCGGWFSFDATSNKSDDGIIVFTPNSLPATGRWIREFSGGPISCRYAGDDGKQSDHTDAAAERIIAYINTNGGTIYYPEGSYYFNDPHTFPSLAQFLTDEKTYFYLNETVKINGVLVHPRSLLLGVADFYTANLDLSDSATVGQFEWFGATGNGSTDDLVAIQKAFDSGCKNFNSQAPQGYLVSDFVNLPFFYSVITQAGVYKVGPLYQIYPGVFQSATVRGGTVLGSTPSSATTIQLSGVYGSNIYTPNSTDGTGDYHFPSKTLDLSDLSKDGDSFSFEIYGDFSNGSTIDIYIYVNESSVFSFPAVVSNGSWSLKGKIVRLVSGYSVMADIVSTAITASNNQSLPISSPATLQLVAGSAGSGDMTQNFFTVKLEPQKP